MAREIVIFTQLFIVLLTQFLFMAGMLTPFDYAAYDACFENSGFTIWEPGFQLICDITSYLNDSFYSRALGRLISITPTIILFVILSKKNLYASIYLFLAIYGLVLGGYRQLIAVSILAIILVIENNKFRKFFLSCFAFLTHYSSFIAVIIFTLLRNIEFSKKKYLTTIAALLFLPIFLQYLIKLEFYNYIFIPDSWIEYLSGGYAVEASTYYSSAKLILIIQSIFAILIVIYSRRTMASQANGRLLIIFESLFIAACLSVDYVMTARFGIYIRLLEMKFIMMDSYGKNIKLAFIFIAFMRLTTMLYGSNLL